MPEPRVAHALICDEVAAVSDGLRSYVGVRSGEFRLSGDRRSKAITFSTVAWLICDAGDVPARIAVRIYGPPGRRLLSASEVKPPIPSRRPDSTKAFYEFVMEGVSLPMLQEGDLEVSIETETGVLRAARLPLVFAQSTASMQDSA